MVADSCPKLAMLAQPPLHDFLRRSGLTWAQWIAQPGRTLWGPCHYNFSSGAIVETKLPLHGGWCWTWETFQFSDGLGVLGRNDASVRSGWPCKSCSPPIIVGLPECSFLSADTTGLKFRCYWVFLWLRIHENRCLKLGLWHHAKVGCKSSCTTGTKITLTLSRKHWQSNFNFSSSNPVPSHSTIFYVSLFGKKGVKYDVKESIFVSSHDGLPSNSKKMPVAMRCQIKKQKSGAL